MCLSVMRGDVQHAERLLDPLALVIVAEYRHVHARGESTSCYGLFAAYLSVCKECCGSLKTHLNLLLLTPILSPSSSAAVSYFDGVDSRRS